jgi:murein L,D-transpeptidase YcbB/YkuD
MRKTSGVVAIVLAGVLSVACGRSDDKQQARQEGTVGTAGRAAAGSMTVASALSAAEPPVFVTRDKEGQQLWALTKQFYQKRGEASAWIEGRKPRPQMDELIQVLQRTDREGLDPALYNASILTARRAEAGKGFLSMKGFDEAEAANLDVWLTYLYLQYASDLTNGVANFAHMDPKWQIRDKKADSLALLEQALEQNSVARSLDGLTPRHAQYTALRDAFAKYRDIEQKGGWPEVPAQMKLKPGQQNAAIPLLARRLAVTGDYTGTPNDQDTTYGPELQEAVKRFQRRHGLEPDGAISAATIAQLNVPVSRRIQQISLNLERWRWLPADLGQRHVLVNIPEYRLEVWDQGKVPLSMRVVVGKKDTPTPIFADDMTHIVFSPYWNIPTEIAKNETVPRALRDPAFLQRSNMEVLDKTGNVVDPASIDVENVGAYRIRQRPGSSNALGFVKFMFPNQFNVYLHDTPTDSLFARAVRSFSHGCVRLEQPEQLAQYVLADQPEWTPERIREAMHSGQEKTVKLTGPLPVYLGYWTARISADGILQFRDDLYGVDARQLSLLGAALDKLKTRAAAAGAAAQAQAPSQRTKDAAAPPVKKGG